MNWNAVIAFGELMGATGVIASLFYLASQVKQNTRSVRRVAYQELLDHIAQLNILVTTHADLADIFVRIRAGLGEVDEIEQMRALSWFGTVCRHYQNAFHQYNDQLITERQWMDMSDGIGRLLANQGGRDMWDRVKPGFQRDFQEMIEIRAQQGPHSAASQAPRQSS